MRILTVCNHGNIRSVAMAYLIKTIYRHEHEVIPVGIKDVSSETFIQLSKWADKIIFMDRNIVPNKIEYINKAPSIFIADVGKDIWHDANNEELRHKCLKYIKDLNL